MLVRCMHVQECHLSFTDLHLSEHLSQGFSSWRHQLSVESTADWEKFGPPKVEISWVLLEEIQGLEDNTVMMRQFI